MITKIGTGSQAASAATELPNGPGAAAILAAGIGCMMIAVFAILGDKSAPFHTFFNFSKPTGPLSGVTTSAIFVWLATWLALGARWRNRNVNLDRINVSAFVLLILSLLLTFPPIADLF